MTRLLRRSRDDRGQAIMMTVLSLTVLVGMTALVLDIGAWFRADRRLQAVADAAVLAGAQELPHDPGRAASVAAQYAAKNAGATVESLAIESASLTNDTISVTYTETVPGFFTRIFGIDSAQARAAAAARAAGATVVGVTQDPGSVVGVECEHVLTHEGIEAKQVLLAQLGWSILRALDAAPEYDEAMAALQAAPKAFLGAVQESEAALDAIAAALHDEPVVYVLGSGPLESAASTLAVCYLQEMQWKHAVAVGSGEFLHGSFEVVTDDLPVIVLVGEDATRPMGERVRRFLDRYTGNAHYIDAAALTLDGVDEPMRPFIGSLVVASTLLGRLAEHFESWTGHSLKDRRYMWKVEY